MLHGSRGTETKSGSLRSSKLPYNELSDEEAEKDRAIVREAVEIYIQRVEELRSKR